MLNRSSRLYTKSRSSYQPQYKCEYRFHFKCILILFLFTLNFTYQSLILLCQCERVASRDLLSFQWCRAQQLTSRVCVFPSVGGAWWWGRTKSDICNCRWACKSRLYCHQQPGRAHIHLFILLDCCHQSEHYKSSPSSIGNLLMHAADQFLTSRANRQSNSSLSLCTNTHQLSLICTNKHIHILCANTHPI